MRPARSPSRRKEWKRSASQKVQAPMRSTCVSDTPARMSWPLFSCAPSRAARRTPFRSAGRLLRRRDSNRRRCPDRSLPIRRQGVCRIPRACVAESSLQSLPRFRANPRGRRRRLDVRGRPAESGSSPQCGSRSSRRGETRAEHRPPRHRPRVDPPQSTKKNESVLRWPYLPGTAGQRGFRIRVAAREGLQGQEK